MGKDEHIAVYVRFNKADSYSQGDIQSQSNEMKECAARRGFISSEPTKETAKEFFEKKGIKTVETVNGTVSVDEL